MEPAHDDRPSVTLITEYFYPEEVSTAQLLTSLATGLQGEFDVSVLTGRPNYHPGDETGSVPSREDHEGVSIERLPATRLDKDTPPLRVVNWLTFTLLVCWRLVRTRDSDDVVPVLSIPPTLPLATWAAKRLRGLSYAYLIYDMDPDFPVALGMVAEDSAVSQAWERVMRMVYRNADRIVVLGDSMKRRLMPKPQRRRWRSGRTTRPIPKNGASVPELPSRPTLLAPTQSRRTGASLRRCTPRPDEEGPPQREYGTANRERLGGFVDLIPSAEDHYARSSARDRRKRLLMGVGSFRPLSRNLRRSNTAFKTSSEHSVPWIVISGS